MKNTLYILLFSALFMMACTERIDVEIEPGFTRLVVEGQITTDTLTHYVQLSTSGDYLIDRSTPKINDAKVYVVVDGDTIHYVKQTEDGLFGSANLFYGVPNKTYQLNVVGVDIDKDGILEDYTAESTMPNPMTVDSISLGYNVRIEVWFVNLWATDPPEDSYYIYKTGVNGTILTDTITEWQLQNDDLFKGGKTLGAFAQTVGQGGSQNAILNDTILLEVSSITKDYFQFSNNLRSETFGSNPLFGGPPANVIGNISDGALGFFSTEAISRTQKVITFVPTVTNTPFGPR